MMGHREKIKGGGEGDAFSGWRKLLCYMQRPRVKHEIKKKFSRRVRKEAKQCLTSLT
jgi:hypothetical protein